MQNIFICKYCNCKIEIHSINVTALFILSPILSISFQFPFLISYETRPEDLNKLYLFISGRP